MTDELVRQGADPDPRIPLDTYTPPIRHQLERQAETLIAARQAVLWELERAQLDDDLRAARRRTLAVTEQKLLRLRQRLQWRRDYGSDPPPAEQGVEARANFPGGREWEVCARNVEVWAGHRFSGHFSERVLRMIGNPEGHPLFELRLDLLEFEVLVARYRRLPHNPLSMRLEVPAELWAWVPVLHTGQLPEEYARPAEPAPWLPPSRHLWECLAKTSHHYAAGLADYLRPGREHWGHG